MAFGFVAAPLRAPVALFTDSDYARQRAFFTAHPELTPTPLRALPGVARAVGVGTIHAKDETARFGLPAFKSVGAIFAISELQRRGELSAGETLVCASEGNHGRAVARAARGAGCAARVYVAASVASSRIAAIATEGAEVIAVAGSYDDAVRAMLADARAHAWRVISDTALDADDVTVPRLIMLGYTRLMDEVEAQLRPGPLPEVIFVPGGVGGLLAAVADWARTREGDRPAVVCVEPANAACLQVSARAGRPTSLAGPFETIMAGLRCGEVSRAGFDTVLTNVDAYVAIEDAWAAEAMCLLAEGSNGDPVIEAGASGAAALGGLLATVRDPALADLKSALRLGPETRVGMLISEGVTDPALFASIVARPKNEQSAAKNREP